MKKLSSIFIMITLSLFMGCSFAVVKQGKIIFENNPSVKVLEQKDLPDDVINFYQLKNDKFLYLCCDKIAKQWIIREYTFNKEYKLLNKFDYKNDNEKYVFGEIINNNFLLISYFFDDEDNYNIFYRSIDPSNGKVLSEQKIMKYPEDEEIKIDNENQDFENYRIMVTLNQNNNFITITYNSFSEDAERDRLIAVVFNPEMKEQYKISKIFRENETIKSKYMSSNGDFYIHTFFNDEDNEKKYSVLYKYSKDESKELSELLPEEIMDEDDYKIFASRMIEDKNDNLVIMSTICVKRIFGKTNEGNLLSIFLAKYDENSNRYTQTNNFEITEEVADKINKTHFVPGGIAPTHLSIYGDNNLFAIFENMYTVTTENLKTYVKTTLGVREEIYFLTFDKDLKPIWQSNIIDRRITVTPDDLYADEYNAINCVKNHDQYIDYYVQNKEPEVGYYKYTIYPDKKELIGPKVLFEYEGGFATLNRKFIETDNGLIFVTFEFDGTVALSTLYYKQKLYRVEFK